MLKPIFMGEQRSSSIIGCYEWQQHKTVLFGLRFSQNSWRLFLPYSSYRCKDQTDMGKQNIHARVWMEDIIGRLHPGKRNTWDIKLTHKERGSEDTIWI